MGSSARIEELEKKFSENARRYFAPLANEYRKAGEVQRAIELCQTFLPQQPGHMSGHIVYGQALFEAGNREEARTIFEAALALDPENLIALRHLGDIARDQGEVESALHWYRRVLDADPRNEEILAQIEVLDAERLAVQERARQAMAAAGPQGGPPVAPAMPSEVGATTPIVGTPVVGTPVVGVPTPATTGSISRDDSAYPASFERLSVADLTLDLSELSPPGGASSEGTDPVFEESPVAGQSSPPVADPGPVAFEFPLFDTEDLSLDLRDASKALPGWNAHPADETASGATAPVDESNIPVAEGNEAPVTTPAEAQGGTPPLELGTSEEWGALEEPSLEEPSADGEAGIGAPAADAASTAFTEWPEELAAIAGEDDAPPAAAGLPDDAGTELSDGFQAELPLQEEPEPSVMAPESEMAAEPSSVGYLFEQPAPAADTSARAVDHGMAGTEQDAVVAEQEAPPVAEQEAPHEMSWDEPAKVEDHESASVVEASLAADVPSAEPEADSVPQANAVDQGDMFDRASPASAAVGEYETPDASAEAAPANVVAEPEPEPEPEPVAAAPETEVVAAAQEPEPPHATSDVLDQSEPNVGEADVESAEPRAVTASGELYVTETMARLYFDQGHIAQALGIYRALAAKRPDEESLRRRVAELEQQVETPVNVEAVPPEAASPPPVQEDEAPVDKDEAPVDTVAVPPEEPVSPLPLLLPEVRELAGAFLRRIALRQVPGYAAASDDAGDEAGSPRLPLADPLAGSLSTLFGGVSVSPADDAAARTLASLFLPPEAPPVSPTAQSIDGGAGSELPPHPTDVASPSPIEEAAPGRPARAASDQLSLDRVFGGPPRTTAPTPVPGFSFDQFFAPGSKTTAPSPEPPSPAAGAAPPKDEVAQFNTWLTGLNRT